MCVYLHTKPQVSSLILNGPLKTRSRLGLNYIWHVQYLYIPLFTDNDLQIDDFLFFNIFMFNFFLYKYIKLLHFGEIYVARLLIASFFSFLKLIISIACSLMDLQKLFIQSSYNANCLQFQMMILQTSKKLMEYVHLLLLWMNFYFYIYQSFK